MAPSETLDCHPTVLAAVCDVTHIRETRQRGDSDREKFRAMHQALDGG